MITRMFFVSSFLVMCGCSAVQEITPFSGEKPSSVCIVKHDAVKEAVLKTIETEYQANGVSTVVVDGIYELKHGLWQPRWYPDQVQTCDALNFYVANWGWDLAAYMKFANIWVTDLAGSEKIAQGTYDATRVAGPSKFISAEEKIKELVSKMLNPVDQKTQ